MSSPVDLTALSRGFRQFADDHHRRAPFTATVAATIADEPDIVAILARAPAEQRLPVLLLAAIHDQVLADPSCELGGWYPTVSIDPRDDDPRTALVEHCRRLEDELTDIVATRSTQTNEVGRCALFLPAFGMLATKIGPLAWVDVGASAGLNLQLDRFAYDYRPGGRLGEPAAVCIEVATRGSVPIPGRVPPIVRRVGLDRAPVDLADPTEARWLRACIWPDQADRLRRLDAAIRTAGDYPVEVRRGDAVDDLAAVIDGVAGDAHPVVTSSWVLNYLPRARRDDYVAELERIGRSRDLSWVFAESPTDAVGLPFDPVVQGRSITAVVLVRWRDGRRRVDHLGVAHPHGYWLHWHDA
jgi:hypothetical protein